MRESCRAVIFKDDKLLLIYREREENIYYVFPGGGIEQGETKEECIKRECMEELGITVNPLKSLYKVKTNFKGCDFLHHIYLCEWIEGELGTGYDHEYDINRIGGLQKPVLIDIHDISTLNVVSKPLADQLLKDIQEYGQILDDETKEIIENRDKEDE